MRTGSLLFTAVAAAAVLAGCATPSGPRATAVLTPTTGNTAAGTVHFVQRGNVVLVSGEIRGHVEELSAKRF